MKRTTMGPEPHGPEATSRRILIVEDQKDAAEALRIALSVRGHSVEVVHDGPTALARAMEQPPDVVVCDLRLPGLDGYELASRFRAQAKGPLCLIALSGYSRAEDVSRARAAGFDRYIAKPPRLEELLRLIAAAPKLSR